MTPEMLTELNAEKRKKRRKQTAEDFTPSWLVKEILNKLTVYNKDCWKDPRKTFIDPACGNGNFLIEVVKRKLISGHKPLDVAKTVFGLDIMKDNITECRIRILRAFDICNSLTNEIVLEVYKNIRTVEDTLKVDFTKNVFKLKVSDDNKTNLIIRKVQEMNNNEKKIITRQRFVKEYFYNNEHIKSLQNVHTPFDLTNSIVKKLGEYTCLTDGKKYLVFNLEFIDSLIENGVSKENITFISECAVKVKCAKEVYGVNGILDDFVNFKSGDKFDVVLANPPYQELKEGNTKSKAIWPMFVKCAFDICKYDGYVSMIHPSTWRTGLKTTNDILNLLKSKNMQFLEMHSVNDGVKTFGAATCYDWYVCNNNVYGGKTHILDELGQNININIQDFDIIPNSHINEISFLFSTNNNDKIDFLYSRSAYGSDKKWMSKEKTNTHIYPVIYSLPKKGKQIWYSSTNQNGHYGVCKIIFSNGAACQLLIDDHGEYSLSQFAFAIIDTPENLIKIKQAMESEKFLNLCKYMSKSFDKYNPTFIKNFKKDFWKYFI